MSEKRPCCYRGGLGVAETVLGPGTQAASILLQPQPPFFRGGVALSGGLGGFCPQGTLGNVWKPFWLSQLGGSATGSQGCCLTSAMPR